MNHIKFCSKIGIVWGIFLLLGLQSVVATTMTLSTTQKTALENSIVFHQGVKPLTPTYTYSINGMTPSEVGDCYNITGTIQILIEDSYTRDANFYSYWKTKITIVPDDHAKFLIGYYMYERTYREGVNKLTLIEHSISIDTLVKEPLQTNVSVDISRLSVFSITDQSYTVDGTIQTQKIEILYTFDALLFDRSNVVPPTTRTTPSTPSTTTVRPTMNTTTNTTSSSSGDDSSSIPETNSIDGYSLPLLMGGIFAGLLIIRKRILF